MIKRLAALLKKDITVGFYNYYVAIMIFTALLFVVVIRFVIPEETVIEPPMYYYVEEEAEAYFAGLISSLNPEDRKVSAQEIEAAMKENMNSLGIVLFFEDAKPTVEFILQGHEGKKTKEMMELFVNAHFPGSIEEKVKVETKILKDLESREQIPFNLFMLPLFVLMEPALLGLILIATMIFIEKEEGTIQAYLVTPGKVFEFLLSKVLFILLLSLVSTCIITVLTVGTTGNLLHLLLVVAAGSIFSSTVGLLLASFFDTLSKSMMWLLILSLLLSVPMVSYFMPGFSPVWIRFMPSYPLMFAIKEALFPVGNSGMIYATTGVFLLMSILLFGITVILYQKNTVRD